MERKQEILSLDNVTKTNQRRKAIPENAICEVCGVSKKERKLRRFNDYILCVKHYNQLEKYGKIIDPNQAIHKKEAQKCCICGERKHASYEGKDYCQKHYLQITRYGKILERTIYDKNEYILYSDYAEIVTYDKNGNKSGTTKIDLDKVNELKQYKVYIKGREDKKYANINMPNGQKLRLNRYLLGITNLDDWDGKTVVDHINGDSLDNRLCNLRICTHKQNMQNIRKKKFVGVKRNNTDTKWVANIMHNYKSIWLGAYETKEEAMFARIKKEKEICGEYGPNKDLYYLVDHPSPIEELQKLYSSEGA